jgi:F0F1-type ATP synthase assembly protein I
MNEEKNSIADQQSKAENFEYQVPVKLNAAMDWSFLGFAGLVLCLFVSYFVTKNIMVFAVGLIVVALLGLIALSVVSVKMLKDYKNQKANWENGPESL